EGEVVLGIEHGTHDSRLGRPSIAAELDAVADALSEPMERRRAQRHLVLLSRDPPAYDRRAEVTAPDVVYQCREVVYTRSRDVEADVHPDEHRHTRVLLQQGEGAVIHLYGLTTVDHPGRPLTCERRVGLKQGNRSA